MANPTRPARVLYMVITVQPPYAAIVALDDPQSWRTALEPYGLRLSPTPPRRFDLASWIDPVQHVLWYRQTVYR